MPMPACLVRTEECKKGERKRERERETMTTTAKGTIKIPIKSYALFNYYPY